MLDAPLAILLASLALVALHGTSRAQSLEEALVSTYLTNPQLEAQRAALRATDELVPQALSDWRPTITAGGSATHSDIDSSARQGTLDTLSSSLTLDQQIYSGGETVANTDRAERLVRAERARLMAVEQDTLFNGVQAYTTLLTDLAVLDFASQNESRLRRQLQATRDRFEVGEVTRTDVAQAEASLAGAVAARVQAEGNILASRAAFRSIINLEPVKLITPKPLSDLPATEDGAQQIAGEINPNIAAAEFDLAAARAEVRIAEAALLPRLSVRGEFTYTDEPSFQLDWERDASIGANLSVPLYQGGGEYARVRQSKQTVRQRQDDLEAALRNVREETTAAWQALTTARTRIQSISEQVRAAEIAVEGSRQEALVGQRTVLDVLDQEQDLFQAQVDLVGAQRDQIIASYRLKAAVGQLTAADIGLPVEPYEAEAYYSDVRNRLIGLGPQLKGR
ncbi:MAG: TolC family outer membrane protein [Geminicoccaceae bacterium]